MQRARRRSGRRPSVCASTGIERDQQELLVAAPRPARSTTQPTSPPVSHRSARAHAEHVAEQDVGEVDGVGADRADEQHAERQRGGEQDADGGVFRRVPCRGEEADAERHDHGRDQRADHQVARRAGRRWRRRAGSRAPGRRPGTPSSAARRSSRGPSRPRRRSATATSARCMNASAKGSVSQSITASASPLVRARARVVRGTSRAVRRTGRSRPCRRERAPGRRRRRPRAAG